MENSVTTYSQPIQFIKSVDKFLNTAVAFMGTVIFVFMALDAIAGIVMRTFEIPNLYGEELARYAQIAGVSLGLILATRGEKHVGVTIFVDALHPQVQTILKVIAAICTVITFGWLSILGLQYTQHGISTNVRSAFMKMPMWYLYGWMFACYFLAFISSIMVFWNRFLTKTHPLDDDLAELKEEGDLDL